MYSVLAFLEFLKDTGSVSTPTVSILFPLKPYRGCHTLVLKSRTEASIRVPRMFNHTHSNNMINR
jgi:hypothetical protein